VLCRACHQAVHHRRRARSSPGNGVV
jgi:hypothetical protein